MGTFRLFTNNQGLSQLEAIDLSKTPAWTVEQATTSIIFRKAPIGHFIDYHPAPRRQFVIILSGQLEIGLKDGSLHVFGPGDARLVEDITGSGHTTATYGYEPCITVTVPIADQ
jgi:hypothetical protein